MFSVRQRRAQKRQFWSGIQCFIPTWGCMSSVHYKRLRRSRFDEKLTVCAQVRLHIPCVQEKGTEGTWPTRNSAFSPHVRLPFLHSSKKDSEEEAPYRNSALGVQRGCMSLVHKRTQKRYLLSGIQPLVPLFSMQESSHQVFCLCSPMLPAFFHEP